MSDLSVRQARPDEYAEVGEIRARAYVEGGILPADYFYVDLLRQVEVPEGVELLVAVDAADRPVGTMTIALPGSAAAEISADDELEFRMLATSPDARGRGVGELLVNAAIEKAREQRLRRVVISVADDNPGAVRLYERLGFRRLPERDWKPAPEVNLLAFGLEAD